MSGSGCVSGRGNHSAVGEHRAARSGRRPGEQADAPQGEHAMELTGARALITGGTGLVGSHIADRLVDEGVAEIVVVATSASNRGRNLGQARERGHITLLDGDVRDPAAMRRAMDGIDVVFHQAAIRITQCAAQPREAIDVLIGGTFNVLEAAAQSGVKKVVAASSAAVYGEPSYVPIDEGHPLNNRTIYGAAKIAEEQLLRSFNEMYALPGVSLRYFNVYGPRMMSSGPHVEVMIRWLERIRASEPPVIYGDGTQTIDFVYVTDVAEANIAAMKSAVSDGVFNIATGTETSLNELAALLLDLIGRPDLHVRHREEREVNPVHRRLAATEKARDKLGFTALVGLREGLSRLLQAGS